MGSLLHPPLAPERPLPATVRDFWALTKPRVVSLVVFTGLVGLVAAPGGMDPVLAFASVLCIALGAGGSAALNQWHEAELDGRMKRTAGRPLPAGRMERATALQFGVGLSVFSVAFLGLVANWLAAAILAISVLYYSVAYTVWLKPRTPQNIVVGGGAGAFPPLIGWVAATGRIDLLPMLLFAIIFFWTPPHFWALSLFMRSDYAAAGIPMLPVVRGERITRHPHRRLHGGAGPGRDGTLGAGADGGPLRPVRPRPERRLHRAGVAGHLEDERGRRSDDVREAAVRLLHRLSVRPVRRSGPGRDLRMSREGREPARLSAAETDAWRSRQRDRARWTALILGSAQTRPVTSPGRCWT